MKQRISVEQLKELSPEQQERLRAWWKPKQFDVYYEEFADGDGYIGSIERESYIPSKEASPLLSIGQCIELLGTKCLVNCPKKQWHVAIIGDVMPVYKWADGECINESELNTKHFYSKELIDALWQAVKEVL